jgi:pilus assembly protein Flp/PilA
MNRLVLRTLAFVRTLLKQEYGQDLVEYALVVALLAFGAVAGTKSMASGLSKAYTTISSALEADVT